MLSFILILFVCPSIVLSICTVLHFRNHFKIKTQCHSNIPKQQKLAFKPARSDTNNYDKHLNLNNLNNLELHIHENNSASNNIDMIPHHLSHRSHPSHLSEMSSFSPSYKESHKFKCKTLIQKCLNSLHIFHSNDKDWNFFPCFFFFYMLFLLLLTLIISLKYNKFTFSMVNNSCTLNHNYSTLTVSHSTFITDWIIVYCAISLNLWQSLFTWYRYYSTRQCSLLRVGDDTNILFIYYSFYLFFFNSLCIIQLHWIYWLFPLIIITHFSYNLFCVIQFSRILWKQYNMFSSPDIKGIEIVNDNMLSSVKIMLCVSLISCIIESFLLSLLLSCYNINLIVYLPLTYSISSFAFSFNFVRNRTSIQYLIQKIQQIIIKQQANNNNNDNNNNNVDINNNNKQKQKKKPPSITPQISSNDSSISLQRNNNNKISNNTEYLKNKIETGSSAKLNGISRDREEVKTVNDRDDSNPSWIMLPTETTTNTLQIIDGINNNEDTPNTASTTLITPSTPKSGITSNIITPISPFTPSDIPQEIKKKKKMKRLPLIKSKTDCESTKTDKKHRNGTKSEPSSPAIKHHPNIIAKFRQSPVLNALNPLNPSNSLNPFNPKHYNISNWAKTLSLDKGLVAYSAGDPVVDDDHDQSENATLQKTSKSEQAQDSMPHSIPFDDWYKHNIHNKGNSNDIDIDIDIDNKFEEGEFVYLGEESDDELDNVEKQKINDIKKCMEDNKENKDENNNDENNNDKQRDNLPFERCNTFKKWNTFKNTIQAIYPENTLKLQASTSEQNVEISSVSKRNSKLSSAAHRRSSSCILKQDILKDIELELNIQNIEEEEEEKQESDDDDDDDDEIDGDYQFKEDIEIKKRQNSKNDEIIAMLRLMVQHGFYSKNTLNSVERLRK